MTYALAYALADARASSGKLGQVLGGDGMKKLCFIILLLGFFISGYTIGIMPMDIYLQSDECIYICRWDYEVYTYVYKWNRDTGIWEIERTMNTPFGCTRVNVHFVAPVN